MPIPLPETLAEYFDVTLVYCFEKKGVLRDENDDNSVIPVLNPDLFKQYVEEGIVQGIHKDSGTIIRK